MKIVTIMVGVSGSGKSSHIRQLMDEEAAKLDQSPAYFMPMVVSADDEFMVDVEVDGVLQRVYKFDPAKTAIAHSNCLNKFLRALVNPTVTHVYVDNTNVGKWERHNYEQAAVNVGAQLVYHVFHCDTVEQIKKCAARNSHGVSAGVVADMAIRFESPDPHEIRERCGIAPDKWPLVYHHGIRE